LLEKEPSRDVWTFRQDLLRIILLAEQVITWDADAIQRFVGKATMDPTSWQDLGTTVVDTLRQEGTDEEALSCLERVIGSMATLSPAHVNDNMRTGEGRKLAGIIAIATVERFLPKGASHRERTQLFVRLAGGESISGLIFSGTIARYDFANTRFVRCHFERVAWANCKFNEGTVFLECQFVGAVSPTQCTGLGSVRFDDCRMGPEAEAMFVSLQVSEGKRRYSADVLRSDIDSVVSKFIIKGGIGLRSVEARNLTKGSISSSRYRDEIVSALSGSILEEHHISGTSGGYNIRKEAVEAVRFYAANNIFTGALREVFERLQKKLAID
jgi:hypothetical protein